MFSIYWEADYCQCRFRFIKRKFQTKEQRSLFFLILAYLALALTLGITIWQECNNTTDKRFAQIQNQLLQIEQTLKENAFDETVLDDLEGKLKEIELVIADLSAGKMMLKNNRNSKNIISRN